MLRGLKYRLEWWNYKFKVWNSLGGVVPRKCSICGHEGTFLSVGLPPRQDGRCPNCGSFERHRLFALVQERHQMIKPDEEVLHFAPEDSVRGIITKTAGKYVRADLDPDAGDIVLNMEDIDLPDESFDVVVASHVLEHVDDKKALSEIRRILRPGGRLIAMIPIVEGWDTTYENESVQTEDERELHFGQYDHVRYYGSDFRDRVKAAGLELTEYTAEEPDVSTYGLMRGEKVFVAVA